jgi:hypothetical protein
VGGKSELAPERRSLIFRFWTIVAVGLCEPGQTAVAEHTASRIQQIEEAVRKLSKSPDSGGLDAHMRDAAHPGLGAEARSFEAHIAESLKTKVSTLKRPRLSREEEDALAKKNVGKWRGPGSPLRASPRVFHLGAVFSSGVAVAPCPL